MARRDDALYSMAVVEALTGLTRRQVRYYEAQGLVHPARTTGRHRLFSTDNLDELLLIKELKEQGYHTMAKLKRALQRKGQQTSHIVMDLPESDATAYFATREILAKRD